jgi:hypothetical protein
MSVLAALASLLLFSGFTIAGIVAPDCAFPSQWNWVRPTNVFLRHAFHIWPLVQTFNSLNQNACTVAAYLGSTCNQGCKIFIIHVTVSLSHHSLTAYTIDPLTPGYMYSSQNLGAIDDGNLCRCSTVMYSLMSACGACQGGDWSTYASSMLPSRSSLMDMPSAGLNTRPTASLYSLFRGEITVAA